MGRSGQQSVASLWLDPADAALRYGERELRVDRVAVGVIAGLAYNATRDTGLKAMSAGHLFGMNVSRVALKEGAYLRSYVYTFIELLAPDLTRKMVEQVLSGERESYEI